MHTAIHEGKRRADAQAKERFDDGVARLPPGRQRAARRAQEAKTHAWLTAMPSCSDQTDLSGDAFRDGLAVRYGYRPPNLPSSCPGCGSAFTLTHALDCAKGGLVIQRHNELRDVIGDVGRMAFGAGSVHKEVVLKEGDGQGREGVRTDLVIRGVWDRQRDASFDVCVTNADAPSYGNRPTRSILATHERRKKNKQVRACEDLSMTFTPLVVTVDGVWGREAEHFFTRLTEQLLTRQGWSDRGRGRVHGWLRARLSVALVRAASLCLRGGRQSWRGVGAMDGAGVFSSDE